MLVRSELTEQVIGCAINVHKLLGPGLLESVYEECLCFELAEAGLPFKRQIALPIVYRDRVLDGGFRADIVVSNVLIIEIKSVDAIHPVHEAQLLTYLRLTRHKIGLLMNFNSTPLERWPAALRHVNRSISVDFRGPQWSPVRPRRARSPCGCKSHPGNGRLAR